MGVEFCQKLFFASIDAKSYESYNHMDFILNMVYHIDLHVLKNPLNMSHLIMVYDPFNVWLNYVC